MPGEKKQPNPSLDWLLGGCTNQIVQGYSFVQPAYSKLSSSLSCSNARVFLARSSPVVSTDDFSFLFVFVYVLMIYLMHFAHYPSLL